MVRKANSELIDADQCVAQQPPGHHTQSSSLALGSWIVCDLRLQRQHRPLVLEKHRIGYAWDQRRWDSFCLVTPNWQCRLPDFLTTATSQGFMDKRSIVSFLQRLPDMWQRM